MISSFRMRSKSGLSGIALWLLASQDLVHFGEGHGSVLQARIRSRFHQFLSDTAQQAKSSSHRRGAGAGPRHAQFLQLAERRTPRGHENVQWCIDGADQLCNRFTVLYARREKAV